MNAEPSGFPVAYSGRKRVSALALTCGIGRRTLLIHLLAGVAPLTLQPVWAAGGSGGADAANNPGGTGGSLLTGTNATGGTADSGGGGGAAAGGGAGAGAGNGGAGGAGGGNGAAGTVANPQGTTIAGATGVAGNNTADAGAGAGGGGEGGYGNVLTGNTAVTNAGTITGGRGGAGGSANGVGSATSQVGHGGDGGIGLLFRAGGSIVNTGTVQGGQGGAPGNARTSANTTTVPAFAQGAGGIGIVGAGLAITNSGTIAAGALGQGISPGANAITFTGGVNSLTLMAGSTITGNVQAASAADTLAFGGPTAFTFNTSLLGTQYLGFGTFNVNGPGTLTVTGTNTFAGPTNVLGGTLQAGNAGALSASSAVTVSANATLNLGGFAQTIGSLGGNAGSAVTLGGATLTTGGDGTSTTFAGAIGAAGDPGGLVKVGGGTFTLTGASNYVGPTAINAGSLQAGADGALAAGSAFSVANGAVLDLNGTTNTIGSLAGAAGSQVRFAGATLTAGGNNGSTTFAGTLGTAGEAGNLVKAGSGTFTLTGTSGITGITYVQAGTLAVGAPNALSPNSFHFVEAGATLNLGGFAQTIGSLGGNAGSAVTLGGATLTTGGDGTSTTFAGAIGAAGDPGGLVKVGGGTFTLTGANTYAGPTTISGGALVLGDGGTSGSIVSNVTNNGLLAVNRSDTYVYGGVVSGAGTLYQAGTGTLVLTGDSTYTGGTLIGSGTLRLGNGGTSGSIRGDVTDYGTLSFNRSDTRTFPGTISGSGGVAQDGSGTTVLTGASTYGGPTSVNAGTLTVDGSIASPTVINAGGLLNGDGQVGAVTVGPGGTLGAGSSRGFGFLVANGDLAFQQNSNYAVRVNATNQNDLVLAFGTANLGGGTVRVQATGNAGDYASFTRYLILNAQNGLIGTFGGVTTNLAFFTPSLSYDRNNVFLDLGNPQFALGATDPSGSAVAAALQASFDQGARGGILATLERLTAAQAGDALRSTAGLGTTGTQQTATEAGKLFTSAMMSQASSWIVGGSRDNNAVTLYKTNPSYAALSAPDPEATTTGAPTVAAPATPTAYERERTWRAWSSGFTANTTIKDATGSGLGFNERTSGGALGADYQVTPNLLAGFAVGGTSSGFSVPQSLTGGTVDAAHIGLFGAFKDGPIYATAGVTFAHFDNDYRRTVSGLDVPQTVRGRFGSDQIGGTFEVGYRVPLGDVTVAPFASVSFFDTVQNRYTERAASPVSADDGSVALRFGQRTVNSVPVALGLQIDGRFELANGWTWIPFARLAYVREFERRRVVDASFAELPGYSFTVTGITPAGAAAAVKVGSRIAFNDTISAFASVETLRGDRQHGYAAMAGLNVILGDTLRVASPTGGSAADPLAATWTTSATPDFRFDSFSGRRGFPPTSSLARGSGWQTYDSVLLAASGSLGEDFALSFSAKPGYIASAQTTPGLKGSASTFSDTTASGTLTYLGIPGIQPFLSLSLNLPSGQPVLLGRRGNSRLDPDFVEVGAFGEGLNIGPSLGVTIPVNEKFVVTTSVGYTHHSPYLKDGGIDPTTFAQGTSRFDPGQDYTASVSLGYTDGPWSTQFSESFSRNTITYVDGTPSYQLGDRLITSLTQGYTWNEATATTVTATYIYGLRNRVLNASIPTFTSEFENSNNSVLRMRIDQPYKIDQYTIGPFATLVYRDRNAYNASSGSFTPAKTLYSLGGSLRYAFNEHASVTGSLEHFWARELARPAFNLPAFSTDGWKTILTGTIEF